MVFTVKEKNHLEDTAWILEKKIITNGFTLESVNLNIQVPSSVYKNLNHLASFR